MFRHEVFRLVVQRDPCGKRRKSKKPQRGRRGPEKRPDECEREPRPRISLRLRRAHFVTIQVCGVLSGVRVDGGVCASPVIQRADSAADSGIALADRSLPLTYLKFLRAGSGSLGLGVSVELFGLSAGRS